MLPPSYRFAGKQLRRSCLFFSKISARCTKCKTKKELRRKGGHNSSQARTLKRLTYVRQNLCPARVPDSSFLYRPTAASAISVSITFATPPGCTESCTRRLAPKLIRSRKYRFQSAGAKLQFLRYWPSELGKLCLTDGGSSRGSVCPKRSVNSQTRT